MLPCFVLQEGSEDDDEKWGGDRLLKVMRDADAVDCLLVCSRYAYPSPLLVSSLFSPIYVSSAP
jgi:hypothetical protein